MSWFEEFNEHLQDASDAFYGAYWDIIDAEEDWDGDHCWSDKK